MGKNKYFKLIVIVLVLILFKFFTGIYKDTEHNEHFFFIKHRPTWQFYFKIVGEKWEFYDTLTPQEKKEVDTYDFYVKNNIYSF